MEPTKNTEQNSEKENDTPKASISDFIKQKRQEKYQAQPLTLNENMPDLSKKLPSNIKQKLQDNEVITYKRKLELEKQNTFVEPNKKLKQNNHYMEDFNKEKKLIQKEEKIPIPEEYTKNYIEYYESTSYVKMTGGNSKNGSFKNAEDLNKKNINVKKVEDLKKIKKYEGEVSNSAYNGFGTLYHKNGKVEFQGHFLNGEINERQARTYYMNGAKKFIGDIVKGQKQGLGEEYHMNGNLKVKGCYIDGLIEGDKVVFYSAFGNVYYIGQIQNGLKHGFGILFYDGNVASLKFVGNFENDNPIGNNCKIYSNIAVDFEQYTTIRTFEDLAACLGEISDIER